MRLRDGLILLAVVAMVGAGAWIWSRPAGLSRAPEVMLTTLDGRQQRLSDLRGHPLLVTFWATTCPGCIKEMPELAALYRELAPQGLKIIGVAMSYDAISDVRALTERRQIPYLIAHDADGRLARAFGEVRLTPTTFLIAADGRIMQQRIGETDIAQLRTTLVELLHEGART